MLQRRIELCSGRTPSADAALQTAGAAANGQPTGPRAGSRRCKSKAKNPRGFGGQSHPIPSIIGQRNRELRVRFFGGSTTRGGDGNLSLSIAAFVGASGGCFTTLRMGKWLILPSAWTDVGQADPFVVLSAGRAVSRFE